MTRPTHTPNRGVRVPDPLWEAAKAEAARRGETVTDVVIRALTRYTRTRTTDTEKETGPQ